MPYTNTQHPSNTRTTVTIVMSIIFGVSIIPTTALGRALQTTPLYFGLENADVPRLYQEVKVKIRKGSTGTDDPKFEAKDKIYFFETTNHCNAFPLSYSCSYELGRKCTVKPPPGVSLWNVVKGSDENSAVATVVFKNREFRVGTMYIICYLKEGGSEGVYSHVYYVSSSKFTENREKGMPFIIHSSIYTAHVTNPAIVYAGQAPVTLSINATPAGVFDRTMTSKGTTYHPYLIPCESAHCTDKDSMASLCSKDNNEGAIATGEVTGFGTNTLTTTFSAPVIPAVAYRVCVPYCFKAGSCESGISWTLVDSFTPIKIHPANPSSYTINPSSSPTTLTFTGSDLKQGDKIRIQTQEHIGKGGLCIFSSTPTVPNDEYTEVVTDTVPTGESPTTIFTITADLAAAFTGQVCYSRKDSPEVWTPVCQTPKATPLYFNLENADTPTLYQEVRVKIRKGTTGNDPNFVFKATDKFYFIEKTATGAGANKCEVIPPVGVTLRSVELGTDGAFADVLIKNAEFTVGAKYEICYIKKDSGCGVVYKATSSVLSGTAETPTDFTVRKTMFTKLEMEPTIVYAGQGPVTLSIIAEPEGYTMVLGDKGVTKRPYLIPYNGGWLNKDKMAALCSRTDNKGTVTTGDVTRSGTSKLTTTFFAPVTPAAAYMVCVPYCFKAAGCQGAVSWALVNSKTPIIFKAANPSSYTIDPNSKTTLTFTGIGLNQGDKIRILAQGKVAQGGLCPTTSSTEYPNSEYTEEVTATIPTSAATSFTIKPESVAAAIGQVCYSRVNHPEVWAPVFQTPMQTPLYFSLENADVPTLYEEVRVKIRKGPTANGNVPKFDASDKVYFIETTRECNPTTCVTGTTCTITPPKGITLWGVNADADKNTAMTNVIIRKADFTVGKTYKMCYAEKGTGTTDGVYSKVYEASSTLMGVDTPVSFTILSSIYTTPVTDPSTVYAGQGPVTLSITAKPITGTVIVKEQITQLPYLIPCPNGGCINGAFSEKDKDDIAALCSKTTNGNTGSIPAGEVTGFGTGKLTAKFSAPVAPVTPAASYGVCVPYCFKAAGCEESAISWTLVDSNTPITFPAKPAEPQLPPKPDASADKDRTNTDKTKAKEADKPKEEARGDKDSKTTEGNVLPKVPPKSGVTVPPMPDVNNGNKTTALSATAISSTIPAVLITSVVFLYLYNW